MYKFFIPEVLILVLLTTGCANRDRSNPLDPKNPTTGGSPTVSNLFSIQDTTFIEWFPLTLADVTGYNVYRKTGDQSNFSLFASLPLEQSAVKDTTVEFGVNYAYEVSAVGQGFESARSVPIEIEPGPTYTWVADNLNRRLLKLTHDSRHVIESVGGFFEILDIEPNPNTGEVWVLDILNSIAGDAVKVSADGQNVGPVVNFISPADMSLDANSGSVWVADSRDKVVAKVDSSGNRLFSIREFANPIFLSVDERTGACWVADNELNRVTRISSDGTQIFSPNIEFNGIRALVVNSTDGSIWIAEQNRVLKLNQNGEQEFELSTQFNLAYRAAVNENTGEIWVIDLSASTVSKFSASGEKVFEVGGFFFPRDLDVNLFDNACLVADTENNRVVRLSSQGQIISTFERLGFPDALGVQN